MADENQVVNQEEANLAPDQEQPEQTTEASEGVNTPEVDGKDYKAIAEQLSRDIKEKNRKIQELKGQAQPEARPVQPAQSDDETVKRFLQTEANATIAMKLQTDPTFKDRIDLVQDYVAKGYDISMADRLAKSDIMDKILTELPKEAAKAVNPKQINTQAIPDKIEFEESGDPLKDFLNDPNVPESAKEAARRQFS